MIKISLIILIALLQPIAIAKTINPVFLDTFEADEIKVISPSETNAIYRLLWNQYDNYPKKNAQQGFEEISHQVSHNGNSSLMVTVEKGHLYLQFFPKPSH